MSRTRPRFLFLLALLPFFHYSAAALNDCQVTLVNGVIRGNCSHPRYDSYTRIPYALPPLDDLRFEPPQPALKWDDILDATVESPPCVSFSAFFDTSMLKQTGQEDCLYVNVYVPRLTKHSKAGTLKVIIFLHPGVFRIDTAELSPEPVMEYGGAIVVTLGYRMGPFGFLSTQNAEIPGNNGLKDQRLAIRWVEENIASFGGDITQVLLMGNSAGSAAVQAHLITGYNDFISAFVATSGSLLNPWAFDREPFNVANELGTMLDCTMDETSEEFKKCLKTKNRTDIWEATNKMHEFYAFRAEIFRPTIEPPETEDAFLTRDPKELIREGKYRHKLFLVGTVVGEGAYLAANLLTRNWEGKEVIEELNTRWEELCPLMFYIDEKTVTEQRRTCKKLKKRYMCGKNFTLDTYKLLERMFGDQYFYKGIDEMVDLHRKAGQRVYRYSAELPTRYNAGNLIAMNRLDLCFGSVHTADSFNIFPPRHFETKINDQFIDERDTIHNLIGLVLSMLDQSSSPMYKKMKLPANVDDDALDLCVLLTYGKEEINLCQQPPVDCKAPLTSVKCYQSSSYAPANTEIKRIVIAIVIMAILLGIASLGIRTKKRPLFKRRGLNSNVNVS